MSKKHKAQAPYISHWLQLCLERHGGSGWEQSGEDAWAPQAQACAMAWAVGLAPGHPKATKTSSMHSAPRQSLFPRTAGLSWQLCPPPPALGGNCFKHSQSCRSESTSHPLPLTAPEARAVHPHPQLKRH